MATVFSGAIGLLPWALGVVGLAVLGYFGWRVGMPMARILQLQAEVKLLTIQLTTAQEDLKAAQAREERCVNRLEEATAELKTANGRIAAFLTVVELKTGVKEALALKP